jgi:hypothetical protein
MKTWYQWQHIELKCMLSNPQQTGMAVIAAPPAVTQNGLGEV